MKQLKPTNLIAVEVPEKAEQLSLTKYKEHAVLNYRIKDDKTPQGYQNWSENIGIDGVNVVLKECEILGEVTKEGIQFDVEPYMEEPSGYVEEGYFGYKDYTLKGWVYCLNNPKESFQSLLKANNVKIPEGKKLLILLKQ